MLSSATKITKAIPVTSKQEEGYVIFCHYYDLPKRQVLLMTTDKEKTRTTLKIFSIDDLNACLVERTIEGEWDLLCIFPDGSVLLNQNNFRSDSQLLQLCPKTLNTLVSQPCGMIRASGAGVIDNDRFCIIERPEWGEKNKPHKISLCSLEEGKYVISASIELSARPLRSGNISDPKTLGNNLFCCTIRGHNTNEFRELIIEIDPVTNAVTERGIIQPKAQHYGSSSGASGSTIVLANGNLLTYHESHDNVQLWDTKGCDLFLMSKPRDENYEISDNHHLYLYKEENDERAFYYINGDQKQYLDLDKLQFQDEQFNSLKCGNEQLVKSVLDITSKRGHTKTLTCIKEWNWADIPSLNQQIVWCLKIKPFPDCVHLLVLKGHDLFIFNMEKLEIKKIDTKRAADCFGKHHVLPNGKVIEFIVRPDDSITHVSIMHFDLPEMQNYRKILTESQHLVRLFFNRNYMPTEITDHIFSYTYTPDSKQELAKKVALNEENESSNCLVM